MKKFLRDLWTVLVERNKTHKALRLLAKQEWSIEFLTAMLVRASNVTHQSLEIVIVGPNGQQFIVRSIDKDKQASVYRDDDIFNHLDDEAKIRAFMEAVR